MVSLEVMPWFSPAVSPEISRVMHNLGYRTEFWPGDEIGRRFFRRVVFMASGFAAGAVIAPGQHAPLLMTLAGAGSFAVTGSALSIDDNQPRRCWALTRCTTLSVSPEILLRLSEVESAWNKELTSYYVRRCVSERFGQMVCHVAKPDRRLGVLMATSLDAVAQPVHAKSRETADGWVRLPHLPSRKLIASVISCSSTTLDQVIRDWSDEGILRHAEGALWMKKTAVTEHRQWLTPFLQMQKDIENAVNVRQNFHFPE